MRNTDPFVYWSSFRNVCDPEGRGFGQNRRRMLDELEDELDRAQQQGKKPDYNARRILFQTVAGVGREDAERAQRLYLRVTEQGGSGNQHLQESMLDLLGFAARPASIPFWKELLELRLSRDRFAERRRQFAIAALASLLAQGENEALEPMIEALGHDHADTRATAAEHLARAYVEAEREPPEEVIARLSSVASEDKALVARFKACTALRQLDRSCAPAMPGGSYELRVWLSGLAKVYRTIELGSGQSFDRLAGAILDAFGWDHDHLYAFYLNGKRFDDRYEVGLPEGDGYAMFGTKTPTVLTGELTLGELSLQKGDKFLFLFDFGDNHEFSIRVTEVRARAGSKTLPRVVKQAGRAPEQYGW